MMCNISRGARQFVVINDEMDDVPDYIQETAQKIVEKEIGVPLKSIFGSTPRRIPLEEFLERRRLFAKFQSANMESMAKRFIKNELCR